MIGAGCLGTVQQGTEPQSTATTSTTDELLLIEDYYPEEFSVSIRGVETDDVLFTRSFNDSGHGTVDLSSRVPADQRIIVTIESNGETLWSERVELYEGYVVKIKEDGTVETDLVEA
ncbi:hypothetical protein [Haloarchaeobius sp. HME9146]|uniref:hypothetical protein n=1 Tax=Haloarchaeobius sp. HME9146 TaxID=2978732 RepID=UPI0021BF6D4F|nr:hypothetical protein [Haloarchaeobius sp. HME9146]MCT9095802.1 hypothetical protein [Haloarchaeobius sp. HME9146]